MGFIKKQVTNQATEHAARAFAEGHTIYVAKLMEQITNSALSGPMGRVAEQIEAIEAEGWQMERMSACEAKAVTGERVGVVCLFRRR